MKVLICWSHISGYITSCWRALGERRDVDHAILAFQSSNTGTIAFNDELVRGLPCTLMSEGEQNDVQHVRSLVADAKPDIVVIPGWFHEPYLQLARDPALANTKHICNSRATRRWRTRSSS
jgi:hypothetical protein